MPSSHCFASSNACSFLTLFSLSKFIDNDIVLSEEETDPASFFNITIFPGVKMPVKRVVSQTTGGCKEPRTKLSPQIDASTVYSDYMNEARLDSLRVPNMCELKMDELNFPMNAMCGDVRCNEHVILHTLHTV